MKLDIFNLRLSGRTRRILAILLFSLVAPLAAADGVTVVLGEDSGAHAEVADKLRSTLTQAGSARTVGKVIPLAALRDADIPHNEIVVAVGAGAMQALAQRNQLALSVLVPRTAYEKLAKQGGRAADTRHFSAIFLDQPWSRQFTLIRLAVPERTRVGILLGPESAEITGSLRSAAKAAGLTAVIEKASDEGDLMPALKRLMDGCDVLLAIPDPLVFNRNTIQSILLTAYRRQIPLFGFSPSYVKAGALAAVYSVPAQIARQAAETIQRLAGDGNLPPPQFPRYFTVGLNPQVARSLSITTDDEATLLNRLTLSAEGPQ